jgi:hypothetical protein
LLVTDKNNFRKSSIKSTVWHPRYLCANNTKQNMVHSVEHDSLFSGEIVICNEAVDREKRLTSVVAGVPAPAAAAAHQSVKINMKNKGQFVTPHQSAMALLPAKKFHADVYVTWPPPLFMIAITLTEVSPEDP